MRLRIVPGFISPPPGFGGLGYTPTGHLRVPLTGCCFYGPLVALFYLQEKKYV
ncbi:hypothetical protein QT346_05010 [Escherichia coli]|nr:hypothetical protein [Escherichia coli]